MFSATHAYLSVQISCYVCTIMYHSPKYSKCNIHPNPQYASIVLSSVESKKHIIFPQKIFKRNCETKFRKQKYYQKIEIFIHPIENFLMIFIATSYPCIIVFSALRCSGSSNDLHNISFQNFLLFCVLA